MGIDSANVDEDSKILHLQQELACIFKSGFTKHLKL